MNNEEIKKDKGAENWKRHMAKIAAKRKAANIAARKSRKAQRAG